LSIITARLQARGNSDDRLWRERRVVYGQFIAQARVCQRAFKDFSLHSEQTLLDDLVLQLDLLASSNAELRIIGSGNVVDLSVRLEDEMRSRVRAANDSAHGHSLLDDPLPLQPLINAMRSGLASHTER